MTSLLGRRIHLAGCISSDEKIASMEQVQAAREFVVELVKALLKEGATFVVPVDGEPVRKADGLPITFDWLVLETIRDHHQKLRPREAARDPRPLVIAVQHYKNNNQIPDEKCTIWDDLFDVDGLVYIENAGSWNMASKRMDLQAQQGDVLITLGGDEGVLYLANLYRDAGKPVIPLNFEIVAADRGSRKLFDTALISSQTHRFFRLINGGNPHAAINRINFRKGHPVAKRVEELMGVIKGLRKPIVFAVRLLNPKEEVHAEVDDYFEAVVQPVVEAMGYELFTMNGENAELSSITQEIFENLHRSSTVVVDITGQRPNCFIELGYALGRGLRVMVTAMDGTLPPFDTQAVPTRFWDSKVSVADRKAEFKAYWEANAQRRRIVEADPLVP